MKLSDGEKLILFMLSELYEKSGIEGEIDPKFIKSAICNGHTWGLSWKYPGVFDSHETNPSVVTQVGNILDMWWFIESAYARLSTEEKARVEAEAAPIGKNVRFRGFDGNYESEYMEVARFLINDLDRFQTFKGRDLNSHLPSINTYTHMYKVFEPMRASLARGHGGQTLGVTQIIELLKAETHPDYR